MGNFSSSGLLFDQQSQLIKTPNAVLQHFFLRMSFVSSRRLEEKLALSSFRTIVMLTIFHRDILAAWATQ